MTTTEKGKYPLNTIYFYLTEGCNLKCRHCWIAPKYQAGEHTFSVLSLDLFRSIIEQAKSLGLSGVKLTGGEPLLHPHINEIIKYIRHVKLSLTVETNGVLCTPEIVQNIVACKNPFISVSLDGANAETHEWVRGVKGCFEDTLIGIQNIVAVGLKPQIIMSIMQHNKDQIENIIRLAENLGAGSVKFNIVGPTSRGEKMHNSGEIPTIEELVEIGSRIENELSFSTSLQISYSHPMAFEPLKRIYSNNGNGCNVCGIYGILGVLSDGSYSLCGIGDVVPELNFGHASSDHLEDIWNTTPTLLEIRTELPSRLEGICGLCLMRTKCLGSCIAQNYYRSKSVFAPFWYCEEAYNKGLFPEGRLIN